MLIDVDVSAVAIGVVAIDVDGVIAHCGESEKMVMPEMLDEDAM